MLESILLGITANLIYEGGKLVIGKLDLPDMTPSVINEIERAQEETLNKWSKNQGAKDRNFLKVSRLIKDYYKGGLNIKDIPKDLSDYLDIFKLTLASKKYQNANNYLRNERNENQLSDILEKLNNEILTKDDFFKTSNEILENQNIMLKKLDGYFSNDSKIQLKAAAKSESSFFIPNIGNISSQIIRTVRLVSESNYENKKLTLGEILLNENDSFIILNGLPGTGKSFELQKLALELCENDCDIIPMYRNLRNFTEAHTIDSFFDLNRIKRFTNVVFILDGLDEIKNEDDFLSKFNSYIDNLGNLHHRFVLSCRSNVVENYKTELGRFVTYELLDLNLNQAKLLLQDLTGKDFEINELYQFSEKSLFLKDPYKLNLIANYYNENSNLESNPRLLWEMYFNKIIEKDKQKLKKKGFKYLSQKKDSKIIAFLLEVTKVLNISEEEIYEVLNCNEDRTRAFVNLAFIYCENSTYFFEHKQLQEYLASLILVSLEFDKIVDIIKVKDTLSIKPSLFNTVSLLLEILDKDDKKDKLITWLIENEPELLFNADTDRVASYREDVFQSYFQKNCISTTIWFNQASSVSLDRIARFADSDINFEYLLKVAEDETHNFRVCTSAIQVLDYFKPRKDNKTKVRLFNLLRPKKYNGYININSSILRLFLSWKLHKEYNELIVDIIEKFEGVDHSAITNGILKLIHADIKNVESYKEFLDREFEFVFNEVKRKNDDKVSRGNRWTFELIIEELESNVLYLEYLKKIINSKNVEYNYEETSFKRYSNKLKEINSTDEGRKLIIGFFTELFTEKKQDYRTRDIAFLLLNGLDIELELFKSLFQPSFFEVTFHMCAKLYALNSDCYAVFNERIGEFEDFESKIICFRNVVASSGNIEEAKRIEGTIIKMGFKIEDSVRDVIPFKTLNNEYLENLQRDLDNIFDKEFLSKKVSNCFSSHGEKFSYQKYRDAVEKKHLFNSFGYKSLEFQFLLELMTIYGKDDVTKEFSLEKLNELELYAYFVLKYISNLIDNRKTREINFSAICIKLQTLVDDFEKSIETENLIVFHNDGSHSYKDYFVFNTVQLIHELLIKPQVNFKVSNDFVLNTLQYYGYSSYSLQLSSFEQFTDLVTDKEGLRNKICTNLKNKLVFQIKEVHVLFALKNSYKESFDDIRAYLLQKDEIYNHDQLLEAYVEKEEISILKELIAKKGVESRSCWASINILLKSGKDEELQINTALNYLSLCTSDNLNEKLFLENASNILFHYNRTEIIDFIVEDLPNRLNIIFKNSMVNFSNYDCLPSSGTQSLVELFHEIYKPRDEDDFTLAYLNRFISTYLANLVKNKGLFDELNTLFIVLKKEIEEVNDESKQYYVNQVLRDIKNAYINKLSKGLEHEEALEIIRGLNA